MHGYARLKRVFEIVQSPHVLRRYESNEWYVQGLFDVGYSMKRQVQAQEE